MAEPARKFDPDIEHDITPPFLKGLEGGGDTNSRRGNLEAVKNSESKPGKLGTGSVAEREAKGSNVIKGPWKSSVTGNKPGSSKFGGLYAAIKKKSPVAVIIALIFGGGATIFMGSGILAPISFITNVADDLNDQLASLDIRNEHMGRNKIPSVERDKAIAGCRTLSIRCKFRTMSKTQVKKFEKAGIKVIGEKGGIFGNRIKPTEYVFENKSYGPKEFAKEINIKSGNSRIRYALRRGINMKYIGFSDKSFINILDKFGISRKPPELRGTKEDRVKALMDRTGANSIDDLKFKPVDKEGNAVPDGEEPHHYLLEGDTGPNPRQYSKKQVGTMKKAISGVQSAVRPTKLTGAALKGLSVLGAVDLACSIKNTIGMAAIAQKVANSVQLAKYAMPVMSLAGQMKAGDISTADSEVLGEFFMNPDNRKTISEIAGSSASDASVKDVANPNYGKNAMDSDLYSMSTTGEVASNPVNTTYSLGMGVSRLLSGVAFSAAIMDTILNVGSDNDMTCRFAQNWFVRGAGVVVAAVGVVTSGGTSLVPQAALFGGMMAAFLAVNYALKSALSGSLFEGGMQDSPVERGAATWTGMAVIEGETAKNRGMMPGNSKQIVAYNQLQNSSKLDYIAMESQDVNPLDVSSQYSFLGSFVRSISGHFSSSANSSSLSGILSLISSSMSSAVNPQATYAKNIDSSRFTKCDDDIYKDAGIDADVQCNIRYVMPTEDLALDTDEVARYMEDNGYVEKDTTTGLPAGYTEPVPSETQNFAMNLLNGAVDSFYNDRNYGDTTAGKEYGQFLDYCAYRSMPFGQTYEESGAFNAADPSWVDGSNCMKQGAPYSYFRIYTFDKTVNAAIDDEYAEDVTSQDSTDPVGSSPNVGNIDIDYTDNGANIPCAAGTTNTNPAIQQGYYEDPSGRISLSYGRSRYRVTTVKVRTCNVGSGKPVNSQISASAKQMLKDNDRLSIYSGFRDMALQTQLWFDNGQDQRYVARPGTSNHQMGIAMDLACDGIKIGGHSNQCFVWLKNNASKYGFKNYDPEPWHWSVNGS